MRLAALKLRLYERVRSDCEYFFTAATLSQCRKLNRLKSPHINVIKINRISDLLSFASRLCRNIHVSGVLSHKRHKCYSTLHGTIAASRGGRLFEGLMHLRVSYGYRLQRTPSDLEPHYRYTTYMVGSSHIQIVHRIVHATLEKFASCI